MSEETILSTAAYQDQLASAVLGLDYVLDALSQQKACVADIERRYRHCEKGIDVLSAETKKARKLHENWRNSHALRFAQKLRGKKEKYDARESQEERIYVAALEREVQEKQGMEILKQLGMEAQSVLNDLLEKACERQSLKAELSSLYSQVFDGAAGDFPEQDELSQEVEAARITQDEIQIRLSSETQAVELLNRADNLLNACRQTITEAISYARWDPWGGNGMNDYAFRTLLNRAQSLSDQASVVVSEARQISPSISDIGRVLIVPWTPNSLISVSEFALQQQIRNSAAEIIKAHMHIKWQSEAAVNRVAYARSQLQEATDLLNIQREELDSMRGRIFKRVTSLRSNIPTDDPPSYEEAAARRDPVDVCDAEDSDSSSEDWETPESTNAMTTEVEV
ncbi:hypothetical protein M378DRAFT_163117 [Amanita muscaria Koide BX008]|uniref:Uncharacterized protein n=1 Tax=Amanita muscaria (strain Koide BX008) TaxID=946122 RepID=A0A0C2WSI4_AMAMK|nr:hypothetical protein M378DRAFT_163117 [Amanita muscaria Koide BX008]